MKLYLKHTEHINTDGEILITVQTYHSQPSGEYCLVWV